MSKKSLKITVAYNSKSGDLWILDRTERGYSFVPVSYNMRRTAVAAAHFQTSGHAVEAIEKLGDYIKVNDFWSLAEFAAWMQQEFGAAEKEEWIISDGFYVVHEPEFPDVLFVAQCVNNKWYIPNKVGPYEGTLIIDSHICTTRPTKTDPYIRKGSIGEYVLTKQEPTVVVTTDRYHELIRKEKEFTRLEKDLYPFRLKVRQ